MSTQAMTKMIADYFRTQPVLKAWLFGSYARGEETPLSDVDLLVQYDEGGISLLKHAAMVCDLEKMLDRPVDIVEDGTLRPRISETVNQERKLIYERGKPTVNASDFYGVWGDDGISAEQAIEELRAMRSFRERPEIFTEPRKG